MRRGRRISAQINGLKDVLVGRLSRPPPEEPWARRSLEFDDDRCSDDDLDRVAVIGVREHDLRRGTGREDEHGRLRC